MNLPVLFSIVALRFTMNIRADQDAPPQFPQTEGSILPPNSDSYDDFEIEQKIRGLTMITEGLNRFAINFYKNVSVSIRGNWVCTPLSVSLALSMALYGSQSTTKIELTRLLGIPKKHTYLARAGIRYLLDTLAENKDVKLKAANNVHLASDGITPLRKFSRILSESHRAMTHDVGPRFTQYSRRRIEERWLTVQGDQHTSHIIGMSDVTFDPMLVLESEVYFRSNSVLGFPHQNTHMGRFWEHGIVKGMARMMLACHRYRYGEIPEVDITFVEIPCRSNGLTDGVSMFILLPKRRTGFYKLQRHLEKVTIDRLSRGQFRNVHLYLPRFEIENFIWLETPLKNMGLQTTFSMQSNFSKIDRSPTLSIRGGGHAARIRVREDDVADGHNPSAPPFGHVPDPANDEEIVRFMVDHPFIALIATRASPPLHPVIIQIALVASP